MVRGIVFLSLLVVVEAIQLIIIAGLISSFIPIRPDPFGADLFPYFITTLQPNRQMLIYHIFLLTCVLGQAACIYFFRQRITDKIFQDKLKRLLCADSVWVLMQCYFIFKVLVYTPLAWAWGFFYFSLAASIISRIFWVEILRWWYQGNDWALSQWSSSKPWTMDLMGWDEYWWVPFFVIAEAVQCLVIFNYLYFKNGAPVPWISYAIFLLSLGPCFIWAKKMDLRQLKTKGFIFMEGLISFFLISALFKMVFYDYRIQLATYAFHVLLVVAVINKICWPLFWETGRAVYTFLSLNRRSRNFRVIGDFLMVVTIVMLLYLPDPIGVLAKMFAGEQIYHMNSFVMAPAWAYVSGCVLDVDVISHYGLGVPIVLSMLTKIFGGFTYLNMLLVFMWGCIIYFIFCYVFLRAWLKSITLAFAAILIGIKLQMFFTLTLPQPLTYPNGTPIRFIFDILFFLAIWAHLRKGQWIYLWLAAFISAGSFFYMMETGLYLTVSLYGYFLMLWLTPKLRLQTFGSVKDKMIGGLCVLSVPLEIFLLFWMAVGWHVVDGQFWYNLLEPARYITTGLNMGPFDGGLHYAQYWDMLVGFSFPILYILTILIIGTLCILEKISKKHLMVVVICLYGLGAHHYFIAMATANNYYTRAMPYVFVIFYWIRMALVHQRPVIRLRVGMALIALCAYALLTNQKYISYPNILNFSRNPLVDPMVAENLPTRMPYFFHKAGWEAAEDLKLPLNSLGEKDEGIVTGFKSDEDLKAYYKQESDYSQDVALIQSLTGPKDAVALISSFEVEILMQAKRKPLFYYFHFLYSRPMRARTYPYDELYSKRQVTRLIDQLKGASSPYVFMERIFLETQFPKSYAYDRQGTMILLDYVKIHYHPVKIGKYLVAMERNH